ncbi:hypothetical protein OESDEN_17902 [Oesophagostomum dentatum]|uniref:DNA repair and recombination protein RAD54-like n=1 Tax=Oesophagostomum dentatum TaxID=61180 RepID=A0A0B1SBV1_OESDE|nr:hypothetical protein OESDEN_17902 [Oesophagostomum dentatum]
MYPYEIYPLGGVGLNLIGASRLILFDSDWNPALDLQAMARIWRDGQTRPCHIYRLVTAGTIDEKILQRQIKKTGLSSVINLSEQSSKNTFLDEELEDIFTLAETQCETHDLLGCRCDGSGLLPAEMEDDEKDEETTDEVEERESEVQEGNESFDEGDVTAQQDKEAAQELQEEVKSADRRGPGPFNAKVVAQQLACCSAAKLLMKQILAAVGM